MSKRNKEKVQVKLELEGPIKDFLESECALECRSLTAHVRYIVNRYYMERKGCLSEQMVTSKYQVVQNKNYDEQSIHLSNQNELQVRNTNFDEQQVNTGNSNVPKNDNFEVEQDVLAEEDFGYINSDVLDF